MVKVNTSQGLIRLEHATDYRIDDNNGVLYVVEKVSETQAASGYKRTMASFAPGFWLSVEIASESDGEYSADIEEAFKVAVHRLSSAANAMQVGLDGRSLESVIELMKRDADFLKGVASRHGMEVEDSRGVTFRADGLS